MPRNSLFLHVADSVRTQVACGFARATAPPGVEVFGVRSASSRINPCGVVARCEVGIHTAGNRTTAGV